MVVTVAPAATGCHNQQQAAPPSLVEAAARVWESGQMWPWKSMHLVCLQGGWLGALVEHTCLDGATASWAVCHIASQSEKLLEDYPSPAQAPALQAPGPTGAAAADVITPDVSPQNCWRPSALAAMWLSEKHCVELPGIGRMDGEGAKLGRGRGSGASLNLLWCMVALEVARAVGQPVVLQQLVHMRHVRAGRYGSAPRPPGWGPSA